MPRKYSIAYFAHAIRSDWNNGNAHFLRGLLRSLGYVGHTVCAWEQDDDWSIRNLREEPEGLRSLEEFARIYPDLNVRTYSAADTCDPRWLRQQLSDCEFVILHEWNPPALAQQLRALRKQLGFKLIFHDTHHRASSSPGQIAHFGLADFDGVLAFGETLRTVYRERFAIERVWTLHEAADTSVFRPARGLRRTTDCVWIGNWGDGERSEEIRRFFLSPAAVLPEYSFRIWGVRYPSEGLAALQQAGVTYGGYLPNLDAPRQYAESSLTVHIPRQQYAHSMTGIPTIRIFEALACGIPLISAPWKDTEGLFREGDFAWASDCAQMRDQMQHLLQNPTEAHAQAMRGLETVLARHTCQHRAEQLSSILEEIAG